MSHRTTLFVGSSLSMSNERKPLEFICGLDISNKKKAVHIQRLILEETITNSYVMEYFSENGLKDLASEFYSLDDIRKRKLNAVSGSEWTEHELDHFKIEFTDTNNPTDICDIIDDIGDKARVFLEANSNLDEATFAVEESSMASRAQNDFQRKLMLVILNPSKESCVDTMMQTFLENVLNDRFCIEPREYDLDSILSTNRTDYSWLKLFQVLGSILQLEYQCEVICALSTEDKNITTSF